jgi:hypothetical protein
LLTTLLLLRCFSGCNPEGSQAPLFERRGSLYQTRDTMSRRFGPGFSTILSTRLPTKCGKPDDHSGWRANKNRCVTHRKRQNSTSYAMSVHAPWFVLAPALLFGCSLENDLSRLYETRPNFYRLHNRPDYYTQTGKRCQGVCPSNF